MSLPTILLVDDEEELRELWHMSIANELEGHYILAGNGEQAIEILKMNHVDVIVSDYRMPHKNGGELFLYNLKTKNLPFILISGGNIEEYPEFKNFLSANPSNTFFAKPLDIDLMIERVKMAVKKGSF